MEGAFDVEYFIDGFRNRKAHWRGLGKSHIYYIRNIKSWRLESFYDKEDFAQLAADDSVPRAFYPLGRYASETDKESAFNVSGTSGRSTLVFVSLMG